MYFLSLALATLQLIYPVLTRPMEHGTNIPKRQQQTSLADCQDSTKDLTPDCWVTLGVDAYIKDWWTTNKDACSTGPYKGDGFASCYQQKVGKGTLLMDQCNTVGVSNCRAPADFSKFTPQEFYVLSSIFGIWQYFTSIYIASDFADGVASGLIGDIVTTINPVTGSNAAGIAVGVISAGLAFVDLPALAAVVPGATIGAGTSAALGSFGTAIQQAPGLVKLLYQPATIDGQFKETNSINSALAHITSTFQTNVANVLLALQSDLDTFLPFATQGNFIVPQGALNAHTTTLTHLLTVYITSQALQAKGYDVNIPVQSMDVYRAGTYNMDLEYGSQADTNMLNTIEAKGWATRDELLKGAVQCAVATVVANGDPFAAPAVDPATLQPVCISSLQVDMELDKRVCNNAFGNSVTCQDQRTAIVKDRSTLNGQTQREWAKQNDKAVDDFLTGKGV